MTTPEASAASANPADDLELRIAVAMNGGVSLAVWIGGVTRELAQLTQRGPVYGDLLACARATARIDVVVGTSAGGINGALLALGLRHGNDLSALRRVWLADGALESLLRDPHESNPPSLLKGNEHFLRRLTDAFTSVADQAALDHAGASGPLDLILTTTLLHGEPSSNVDELGEPIVDTNHRGLLHFRRDDVGERDDFARKDAAARLAYAARATASFPVAFEPVPITVRRNESTPAHGVASDLTGIANFRQSHVVLDGGILDNKPIEKAIDAIYRRRARGEVRRVLAYVTPSLEVPREPRQDEADPARVTLARAAFASLVQLPRHESIAAQIEAIIENNRAAGSRRRRQRTVSEHLLQGGAETQATDMYPAYLARRREGAVEYIVEEVAEALVHASRRRDGDGTPSGAQQFDRRRRERLHDYLMGRPEFPWTPPSGSFEAVATAAYAAAREGRWRWGQYALENLMAVALDLLRDAAMAVPPAAVPEFDPLLIAARQTVYEAREQISGWLQRLKPRGSIWRADVETLTRAFADSPRADLASVSGVADAAIGAPDAFGAWWQASLKRYAEDGRERHLAQIVVDVVDALFGAIPALQVIARLQDSAIIERERESARRVAVLLGVLVSPNKELSPARVLERLLALEVVLYVADMRGLGREPYVELVQFSARGRSALGGPERPDEKLAGLQMANFGAFYKRAWRANDWMWGRLDGASRLVRILLDPLRLVRVHARRPAGTVAPNERASELLYAQLREAGLRHCLVPEDREYLQQLWRDGQQKLLRELAFLDTPGQGVPDALPCCTELLLRALHLRIIREELPNVVEAIEHDRANGADGRGVSADFLRLYRSRAGTARGLDAVPPIGLIELLNACTIGRERIRDEVGTDRFLLTTTRLASVAVAALSSEASGLGPLAGLIRVLRIPTAAADALARLVVTRSRSSVALATALATAAATILVIALLTNAQLGAAVLYVAWGVLVAVVAFALLGGGWTRFGMWVLGLGMLLAAVSVPLRELLVLVAYALRTWLKGA